MADTLGELIDKGAPVIARCVACSYYAPADLAAMAAKLGHSHSLRNYRCKCRTPNCRGWIQFSIKGGMRNTSLVDQEVAYRWKYVEPDRWRPVRP